MVSRFVGRDTELGFIGGLLGDGATHTVFVAVEGEAGIGKTRLLAEARDAALARGARVFAGSAAPFERGLPFALVVDAFPVLFDASVDADDEATWELGAARHLRYRAVRALLADAARTGGVLLALDDVQCGDDASLELLSYLARHPPDGRVVVLVAYRTGQCPPSLAGALRAAGRSVHRLRLPPLRPSDVDALLVEETGGRRRLLHLTGSGNPLYLEILRTMPDAAIAAIAAGPTGVEHSVGAGLAGAIAADLHTLDRDQRLVVQAAAVLGDEFHPAILAHVAQTTVRVATQALDVLVSRDLLRVTDGQLGFRHPLVQAAAYQHAGVGWRLRAHRRAAAYLQRREAPLVRLARHLELAAEPGDEHAVDVLATAAQATLDTAPSISVRWLAAALRILPERPDAAARRTQLGLHLAKALILSGRLEQARAQLHALSGLTGHERTTAARLLAMVARLLGELPQARTLLLAELARTADPRAESTLRAELLAAEMLAGRWRDVATAVTVLERDSQEAEPARAAARAVVLALASVPGGTLDSVLDRVGRAKALIDGIDDTTLRDMLDVLVALAWTELLADQTADVLRHVQRGVRLAHRYGRTHILPQLAPIRSITYCRIGRIVEAIAEAEDAEEMARLVGSEEMRLFAAAIKLRPLSWRSGPAAMAAAELDTCAPLGSRLHRLVAAPIAAEALLGLGLPAEAVHRLTEWVGDTPTTLGLLAPTSCALLAEADIASGDLGRAREWLYRAEAAGGTLTPLQRGIVAYGYARLMLADNNPRQAVDHAQRAIEYLVRAANPVREGLARVALAEALLGTDRTGDARGQLGTAKARFTAAGASWLADRTSRTQRRVGACLPRASGDAASHGARLTGREREVAELVAEGLTNKAIADQLYLSPRTVEGHLARILTKLGVASRSAIARRLQRP
jgi:DNA-binding CsgD family transcriptional regulator